MRFTDRTCLSGRKRHRFSKRILVKAVPESVSSRFGACNSLQGDILLGDAQVNAAPVQEPMSTFRERNGEIGVAKFLAMKKGGRR
jgi:hypothetical protein